MNFCLVFVLLFTDPFILAGYVSIFSEVLSIKKAWATCEMYCPPPEGYPSDLIEFDKGSGWCFYPPTGSSSSSYPCPHPYLYDGIYKKCKAYPQCSEGCVWNPDIRQCEEIPQTSGEIPSGGEYSGMICVKGEITNDEVDNPGGIEIQNCIALNPQCPSNSQFDSNTNLCYTLPVLYCPSGSQLDSGTNTCTLPSSSCPEGFTYNTLTSRCESSLPDTTQYLCPIDLAQCQTQVEYYCPPDSQLSGDVCSTSATPVCPSGSSYDSSTNTCYVYVTPSCPSGFTYNSSTNRCEADPSFSCPSGTSYNSSTGKCESNPSYVDNVSQVIQHVSFNYGYNPTQASSCSFEDYYVCEYNPEFDTWECNYVCHPTEIVWETDSVSLVTGWCTGDLDQWYKYRGCNSNTWTFIVKHPHLISYAGLDYFGGNDYAVFYINGQQYHSSGKTCGGGKDLTSVFKSLPPDSTVTVQMTGCDSSGCCSGLYGKFRITISSGFVCAVGTYDQSSGKCVTDSNPDCTTGTYDESSGKCVVYPSNSCPSGFTYNSSRNRCETSPTYSCPSDFTYNPSTGRCETPPTVAQNDICPYGQDKPCVEYNGQKVCSPYSCGKLEDTDTPDEPPSGLEDDTDFEEGSCLGTIYIFNGKKMRCRKAGIQTGFHNCCDESQGKLYDSTGSTGMMLGDAIKAIYFAMEIVKQARLVSSVEVIRVYGGNVELLGGPGQVLGSYPVNSPMGEVWQNVGTSLTKGGVNYGDFIDYNVGAVSDDTKFSVYAKEYLNKFAPQLAAQIITFALSRAIGDPVLSAAVDLVAQALLAAMHLASPVGIALAAVNLGLALFMTRCDTQDILTSTLNESKYCHYVGTRCIKKFLGMCLQKAKVFCCFNSKLARIIHEQGRPQLSTFGPSGGWGSAKRPNCRGFTPEEFQAIDFAKIDFSEYVEDIQRNIRQNVEPQMMEIFQKSVSLGSGS
ncbi:MAG: conjugal transfer protein TraN [Nitrososphaeria archaeon]